MIETFLTIIVWIAFGIYNWGATLGDFCGVLQSQNARKYYGFAGLMAFCSVFAFPACLFASNFHEHGFRWR